jgi:hypothetical protein
VRRADSSRSPIAIKSRASPQSGAVEQQVSDALKHRSYDVIVVGVGLRTLPPMAAHFERLINVLHEKAPRTKLAFNSKPDDSDAAALRWL